MNEALAALAAAVIVLLLVVATAWGWWHLTGWKSFSYSIGDTVSWTAAEGSDVSSLRFKNCKFTSKKTTGDSKTIDVTAVLNGMAVAYEGADSTPGFSIPTTLPLVRALNPFSFIITGFNDVTTVGAGKNSGPDWCTNGTKSCTVDSDCSATVRGSTCAGYVPATGTAGACTLCATTAGATLTGYYRTI